MRSTGSRFVVVAAVAASAGMGIGCGGAIYTQDGPRPTLDAVSDRGAWQISGDLADLPKAIDGNIDTAATTGKSYGGAAVTIDLGEPCMFNMIAIEHGDREFGFSRRVAVSVSLDGKAFTRCYEAPGTRRVTTLCLVRFVLARYVRLEALKAGPEPWAIAEIHLQ